jgi:MotA/TolQ/ExbB proton channel family protein
MLVRAVNIECYKLRALGRGTRKIHLLSDGIVDDAFKERVALRLERVQAAMTRQISRGTGLLATIGATAPFVGLFGTVWGIMNSFIGISESHTTNLAVVAPGTSEVGYLTTEGDVQVWEVMWHKLERHVSMIVRLPVIEGESAWDAGSRAIELGREAARELMSIEPKRKSWFDGRN